MNSTYIHFSHREAISAIDSVIYEAAQALAKDDGDEDRPLPDSVDDSDVAEGLEGVALHNLLHACRQSAISAVPRLLCLRNSPLSPLLQRRVSRQKATWNRCFRGHNKILCSASWSHRICTLFSGLCCIHKLQTSSPRRWRAALTSWLISSAATRGASVGGCMTGCWSPRFELCELPFLDISESSCRWPKVSSGTSGCEWTSGTTQGALLTCTMLLHCCALQAARPSASFQR